MKFIHALALALLYSLGFVAYAANSASAENLANEPQDAPQRIEVTGERATLLYPYKRAYEAAKKVLEVGKGDVQLQFRFVAINSAAYVNDIKLRLVYDGGEESIPVNSEGVFMVMPNDIAANSGGQFIFNKRRDDYRIEVDLAPNLKAQDARVADLRRVIDSGLAVRKAMMPWYARAVMQTVGGIRICADSSEPPVAVRVDGQIQSIIPYKSVENHPTGKPHCADVPRGSVWPDQAIISIPSTASVDYYGSFF